MAPVFSLVLDKDVNEETALLYPELYKELSKGRSLSFKTFFIWLWISIYQGGVIMMLALYLFGDEFLNIVSISFTALIFNGIFFCWRLFLLNRVVDGCFGDTNLASIYVFIVDCDVSDIPWINACFTVLFWYKIIFLSIYSITYDDNLDLSFIMTWGFVWKVAVITGVSSFPLYVLKYCKLKFNPPAYMKL